jgi:hypothetical protein
MALKFLAISVLALSLLTSCAPARQEKAETAAPEREVAAPERGFVTHAELAQRIVWIMGDEPKMPARATGLDYEMYLSGKGIAPLGGWRHDELVTKGDLAVVTVRLFRLQDRIEDPTEESAYVALLESIELRGTIIE